MIVANEAFISIMSLLLSFRAQSNNFSEVEDYVIRNMRLAESVVPSQLNKIMFHDG